MIVNVIGSGTILTTTTLPMVDMRSFGWSELSNLDFVWGGGNLLPCAVVYREYLIVPRRFM